MMQKLNLQLGNADDSTHAFYLLMDDISLTTVRPVIEWIFDANFSEERPEMLNLIICSPGGDLNAGFALVDTMRGSAVPIRTIGLGQIASAGLLIFIAGEKGQRLLTPNTSILSHQYSWGSFGKEHELFAQVKEFDLTTKRMIAHYKKCTGLTEAVIREILLPPQDVWLSAVEAKKLGLADEVKDLK
ncbi:ClpP Protease subunit of ATP-dependent Clp proteases [uncultured Caudovirales phage]|uniref:ClpP Protease subunit of ATP-dependent Clp proteases n=1 Tax=uncultured Caudovirales phage TaxID=2100421 RepID=A0A6J5KSX5_9CAUD|nr:ClpP Protease subunit of ATP-dependent Clp proteases [uncultured Caudovirales phage]